MPRAATAKNTKIKKAPATRGLVAPSTRSPKTASKTTPKAAAKTTKPVAAPALKVSKDELRAQVEKLEQTIVTLRSKNRELTRAAKVGTSKTVEKAPKAATKASKSRTSTATANTPTENDASPQS